MGPPSSFLSILFSASCDIVLSTNFKYGWLGGGYWQAFRLLFLLISHFLSSFSFLDYFLSTSFSQDMSNWHLHFFLS